MNHFIYLMPVMILSNLIALCYSQKHFLMSLLTLEAMTLTMIIMLFSVMSSHLYLSAVNMLMIISMGACEASLGLSCLVKMMRSYGSDNLNLLTLK